MAAVGQPPVGPQRTYVSFTADVNPTTTESLLGLCAQLALQRVPEVYLLLSTPGGQVASGIAIYNVLRAMPFRLITHNVGNVDSIGNVIFLAGAERYTCPNTSFMFHGVGWDITTQVRLEEKNLREYLGSVTAEHQKIGAIMAERTRLRLDEIEELFRGAVTRDPNYALANGIVNEIRDVQIPPGAPIHQLVFQR